MNIKCKLTITSCVIKLDDVVVDRTVTLLVLGGQQPVLAPPVPAAGDHVDADHAHHHHHGQRLQPRHHQRAPPPAQVIKAGPAPRAAHQPAQTLSSDPDTGRHPVHLEFEAFSDLSFILVNFISL